MPVSHSFAEVHDVLQTLFPNNRIDTAQRMRYDAAGTRLRRITVDGLNATFFAEIGDKLRKQLCGISVIVRPTPFGDQGRDSMILDVYFRETSPLSSALHQVSRLIGVIAFVFALTGSIRCTS